MIDRAERSVERFWRAISRSTGRVRVPPSGLRGDIVEIKSATGKLGEIARIVGGRSP